MRVALVFVAACSSSKPAATVDAALVEIPTFLPLLCTGGTPGDASCPVNEVDATVIRLSFTAQPVNDQLRIPDLRFTFMVDPQLKHPRFVVSGIPDPTDQLSDVVVMNGPLGRVVTLGVGSPSAELSMTFEHQ